MQTSYSPSVNIIRDREKDLHYLVTPNAERTALHLLNSITEGYKSFMLIGSYGTGKSSFLWAFEQTLTDKKKLFNLQVPIRFSKPLVHEMIGEYTSFKSAFIRSFDLENSILSSAQLFTDLSNRINNQPLIILVDEFGKFLEFGAANNVEEELYFLQELAEFVNDPENNCLLITTLHQSLDAYVHELSVAQRNEWKKVSGRFKELAFNEPIEQLLTLAAEQFKQIETGSETFDSSYITLLNQLLESNHFYPSQQGFLKTINSALFPLDVFSSYALTRALQKYGQNERSLFSFLRSETLLIRLEHLGFAEVFDYLHNQFYNFIHSRANPDFGHWFSTKNALERVETSAVIDDKRLAEKVIKTIGLLQIFSNKGAAVNERFFEDYFSDQYTKAEILKTLETLEKAQIIRFNRFDQSFRLFEGSDFDIESALLKAENQIERNQNIVQKLKNLFDYPLEQAKAVSYKTGTPRYFDYILSEQPLKLEPLDEIDGYINLVFNAQLKGSDIQKASAKVKEAILYAYFEHTEQIDNLLFTIQKAEYVLKSIEDDQDRVAIRELNELISGLREELNQKVQHELFSGKSVKWYFNGKERFITSKKELTKLLSEICEHFYPQTPVLRNELINKQKLSGAIATARKNYLEALVKYHELEDLGFAKDKFPAEKTIYMSLLQRSGMHIRDGAIFTLQPPVNDLKVLWDVCDTFLTEAKEERKSIADLMNRLAKKPYKLKQGLIDFWVPTFLFVRRGDYALYSEGKFKPYINDDELHLVIRTPQLYTVKAFVLDDLRLKFFNKYRSFLQQQDSTNLTVQSFIESIRPILLMYRDLDQYSKTTKRLSFEAQRLREAISKAQDPEQVFFDDFPRALGYDHEQLKEESRFDDYINSFQTTLAEIRYAYKELLNRFEQFIQKEVIRKDIDFATYKKDLQHRFASLEEHQLRPEQKTLLMRIQSPIDDRDSWLASIGQAVIGKPLTQLSDFEEELLKDKFRHMISELGNLLEIQKISVDSNKEEVFKFDFTSHDSGTRPYLVRVPFTEIEEKQTKLTSYLEQFEADKELRIALLAKLLKEELNNEPN